MVEELSRATRVLGKDGRDGTQDIDGPVRQIPEVADRGTDEVELAAYAACCRNFMSSCGFGTAPIT